MIDNTHHVCFSVAYGYWRANVHGGLGTPSRIGYNGYMGNIVTYIQGNQRTFAESPFNPVDSLVLSTLSYFNFEVCPQVLPASAERVLLHDVVALTDWKALTCASWLEDAKDTQLFMQALMASRRYRETYLTFYVNERAEAVEKQFSATTFFLSNIPEAAPTCLAFRGTDGSLAGWKEDFNLCFKSVIPSQRAAAAYVSGVASAVEGPLVLSGHSKGGNLAEFAALVSEKALYQRIQGVYNHDGPSFLGDPSPRMSERGFETVLHKTVPESSAFGMILERRPNYRVVRSTKLSVFQHEPFSWIVEDCDFVYQDELNASARFFDDTLDTWLRGKTPEERERFIDTIYELFMSTEASTWSDFQAKLVVNTRQMLGRGSRLDPETRRFILKTLGSLASVLKDETVKRFKPSPPEWLPRRRERYANSCLHNESQDETITEIKPEGNGESKGSKHA
ncbi:MAG: Mbeg1-like protein [Gordonibacter sp.]|nr:Mbeg1-like protein [Gordonibacter sp.]